MVCSICKKEGHNKNNKKYHPNNIENYSNKENKNNNNNNNKQNLTNQIISHGTSNMSIKSKISETTIC